MKAQQLWFTSPHNVEIREQKIPLLAPEQLLVRSICSAVSAGSEMLVYRGQIPSDIPLDATLDSLQHHQTYPLQYGYACVGLIEQIGHGVDPAWLDKRVFAFQPHASHFIATPEQLIALPDDIEPEAAVFLANMETAVNLVLDGGPALGERVAVLGQGIVGLLLTSLLAQFPLTDLHALDGITGRRASALNLGADQVCDPTSAQEIATLKQALRLPVQLQSAPGAGADLIYEVSGVPDALNLAIELCGFSGRIVLGSWYGNKASRVNLGGASHRNRIQFVSSQVSTIAPALTGRWDKSRRFKTAWDMIRRIQPRQLISHRLPLQQAGSLYEMLDKTPEIVLQAIFIY
ncbi:MAG: zinc-dependent alcohol dehydrogenase [Methylomonas sp.]